LLYNVCCHGSFRCPSIVVAPRLLVRGAAGRDRDLSALIGLLLPTFAKAPPAVADRDVPRPTSKYRLALQHT
jgi:hypothetical protein